ncbi:hypothetical protein BC832DRAFT_229266 [Gaertneriomyces semiglobifer]|nr:hypothetical protein BC832DRAFT_229266 [Gaertneriomyces semiglobifer]
MAHSVLLPPLLRRVLHLICLSLLWGGTTGSTLGNTPEKHHFRLPRDEAAQLVYFKDQSSLLLRTKREQLHVSSDNGRKWKDSELRSVIGVTLHETSTKRAFAFTRTGIAVTHDSGQTFAELPTPKKYNILGLPILDFHPDSSKSDWLTFLGHADDNACNGFGGGVCHTEAFATKNEHKDWVSVTTWAEKCVWARDLDYDSPSLPEDAVYCIEWKDKGGNIAQPRLSPATNQLQLVLHLPWEKDEAKKRQVLAGGRDKESVVEFFVLGGTLLAAVQDQGTEKVELITSENGKDFTHVELISHPAHTTDSFFTLLHSVPNSVFLAAARKGDDDSGLLFKSSGNSSYFSATLNSIARDKRQKVDYEKLGGLNSVELANIRNDDGLRSLISYDDGATWQGLHPPKLGFKGSQLPCNPNRPADCTLHLHHHTTSPPSRSAVIKRSSERVPGLVLAKGNVGSGLSAWKDGSLWASWDGGKEWKEAWRDTEQGLGSWAATGGGAIWVVAGEGVVNTVHYSLDKGETWTKLALDVEISLRMLSSSSQSPDAVVHLVGEKEGELVVVTLDFQQVPICNHSQMDTWVAPCWFGRERHIWRKKDGNHLCRINLSGDQWDREKDKSCPCTEGDWHCAYGFYRGASFRCIPTPAMLASLQPATCAPKSNFTSPSGYSRNSHNKCEPGVDHAPDVQRPCSNDSVRIAAKHFLSEEEDYVWINGTKTLLVLFKDGTVWKSVDAGQVWQKEGAPQKPVVSLMPDEHWANPPQSRVWLITTGEVLYKTQDSAAVVTSIKVPAPAWVDLRGVRPATGVLRSHPLEPDWLLWISKSPGCTTGAMADCYGQLHFSNNGGASWVLALQRTTQCTFFESNVFCMHDSTEVRSTVLKKFAIEGSGRNAKLVVQDMQKVEGVVGMVALPDWLLTAVHDRPTRMFSLYIKPKNTGSAGGAEFRPATFPKEFNLDDTGYTVLQSSTGRVFLDAVISRWIDKEWGSILRSGIGADWYEEVRIASAGGTSVGANMDAKGYVDFEKLAGLEGIALLNVVENVDQVKLGAEKVLGTRISFDDGAVWEYLSTTPKCQEESCRLHLHSYTHRHDARDTFTSPSSPHILIGAGNVGSSLLPHSRASMFISKDAGLSWKPVIDGSWRWEILAGGLTVLVQEEKGVNGGVWLWDRKLPEAFNFSAAVEEALDFKGKNHDTRLHLTKHTHMISDPSGLGTDVVLFGTVKDVKGVVAVAMDFKGLAGPCKGDEWEWWNPPGNAADSSVCFFGAVMEYPRLPEAVRCFPDQVPSQRIVRRCECTTRDYDCDSGFVPSTLSSNETDHSRTCVRARDLRDPQPVCVDGTLRRPTGWKKVALSRCEGGVQETYEYGERLGSCGDGASFASFWRWLLWILGLCLLALGAVACWKGRFQLGSRTGRIRLPDSDASRGIGSRELPGMGQRLQVAGQVVREAGEIVTGVLGPLWRKAAAMLGFTAFRSRQADGYVAVFAEEGQQDLFGVDEFPDEHSDSP